MRLTGLALAFCSAASLAQAQPAEIAQCPAGIERPADEILADALEALGGRSVIEAADAIQVRGLRRRNFLEQSIRPSPPWIDGIADVVQLRWFSGETLQETTRARGAAGQWHTDAGWAEGGALISKGDAFSITSEGLRPGNHAGVSPAQESLELGPERVVVTALSASDHRLEGCRLERGFMHQVVGFTWRGAPARLLLQPVSHMPSVVEVTRPRPYDIYWSAWGDVTTRYVFDLWTREASGLRYPRRWTREEDGVEAESFFIDHVKLDAPTDAAPSPPEAWRAAVRAGVTRVDEYAASAEPVTLAPGVLLHPGAWNVVTVAGAEGVHIIDAPIGPGYSRSILDRVRAFPLRVSGVVSTSDAWPHISGVPAYVGEGLPVWVLDLNEPLVRRLVDRALPSKAGADLRAIIGRTALGTGDNRFEVIPYRTVTGERQMAVYWPEHRLLYTSDLISVMGDGTLYLPQFVDEIADMIERENLDVETVAGMHYGPAVWSEIVDRARRS